MLREKTVFVLGAGASADYGFPLGSELREKIQNLYSDQPNDKLTGKEKDFIKWFLTEKPYLKDNWNETIAEISGWEEEVEAIKDGLEGISSIDDYIFKHPDTYIAFALKSAVAFYIIWAETKVFSKPIWRNRDKSKKSCYHQIWDSLSQGVDRHTVEHIFNPEINNVQFITFNYDRSLEYFLRGMISKVYRLRGIGNQEKIDQIMSTLDICHVYGSLGQNMKEHKKSLRLMRRGFDIEAMSQNMMTWAEEKTYPEITTSNDWVQMQQWNSNVEKIRKWVTEADNIFFLGMGYHVQHMEILFPERKIPAKHFHGTSIGIPERKQDAILKQLNNRFINCECTLEELSICNLLNKYSDLLSEFIISPPPIENLKMYGCS